MKSDTAWQLFAVASAFFAGLTAILGKLGVEGLNSNLATLIRTAVVFIITALIITWRQEWVWSNDFRMKPVIFLLLSGLATGLSWLFYYRALQMAPASLVAPIDKLSVVFAIILAILFLGEPITPRLFTGALLVLSGVLVLAWPT
ncbi:MAG: EamA family transporter [Gammaproteobacteria bacterium]|jgi:transporter family protein|nr:EamA family transporter [Gammaproteobacteria bacterium]NBT43331.1 EamA family transporter [Gammaproteobacteria bacterium]NBY21903.1 EamA family transporter [Gammaproteobacteria bacterium]